MRNFEQVVGMPKEEFVEDLKWWAVIVGTLMFIGLCAARFQNPGTPFLP